MSSRTAFFNAIRGYFDGALTSAQVQGIESLLDECAEHALSLYHTAFILANVHRETGGYMSPIKETVQAYHKDKNPSDATVKARLERAYKAGKLKGVTVAYWRDGAFGRGQIQLSTWPNYEKMSPIVGIDLVKYPERTLELKVSAKIAVVGMIRGMFTGKKLADYQFPAAVDSPSRLNPRRIVNGVDGSDAEVAKHFKAYTTALNAMGWSNEVAAKASKAANTTIGSSTVSAQSASAGTGAGTSATSAKPAEPKKSWWASLFSFWLD